MYGDSAEDCLVAVAVPDVDTVQQVLSEHVIASSLQGLSLHDICRLHGAELKAVMMAEFAALALKHGLNGYENVKSVWLEPEPWINTGENCILTPTMKLKRMDAKKRYAAAIRAMYDEIKGGAKPRAKL